MSPKRTEAAEVREQAVAQDATNASLQTQLEVLKAQAKDLPKKQADLARVAAKIPDNPGLPALIRSLTAAAASSGVELRVGDARPAGAAAAGVAPVTAPVAGAAAPAAAPVAPVDAAAAAAAPAGAAGSLASIPVAINVVGGYFEAEQFLASLENLPRAYRVTNLTMAPGTSPTAKEKEGAEDGRTLTTTITGSVFMAANRPPATPVVVPAK